MKYAAEYERILQESNFPMEWKEHAIEYKHLKKLIKNVSNELSGLGLNPVVLNRLLHPPHSTSSSPVAGESPTDTESSTNGDNEDDIELDFSSDSSEGSPKITPSSAIAPTSLLSVPRRKVRTWSDGKGKRFRVRVKNAHKEGESSDSRDTSEDRERSDEGEGITRKGKGSHPHVHHHVKGGFKAEYVLDGT